MRCVGKHGIGGRLVANGPFVAAVIGRYLMHHSASHFASCSILHRHHGGQGVVIHIDQLGRITRLLQGLSHHHGHLIADIAHGIERQDRVRRLLHGLAVGAGNQPTTG